MSLSNVIHLRWEWKDYSKTKIYMLFLQKCLMIFEEAIRNLKKKKKPSYNKHMTQFYVIWLLYISRGEKVTIKGQPTYMEFSQFLY